VHGMSATSLLLVAFLPLTAGDSGQVPPALRGRSRVSPAASPWTIVGPCVVDENDAACVTSPNYPEQYGNDEHCVLRVHGTNATMYAELVQFDTERSYDKLLVNGVQYSGSKSDVVALQGAVLDSSPIIWTSDSSDAEFGWKICARDAAPETTTTTTSVPGSWLIGGPCTIDVSDPACVTSPNFPDLYGNSESCEMSINGDLTRYLEVAAFATETSYDILYVNGQEYSGGDQAIRNIEGEAIQGSIAWISDESGLGIGWKICARTTVPSTSTFTTTSGVPGSWVVTGACELARWDSDCVTSSGFREGLGYGHNEGCSMSIYGGVPKYLEVLSFDTDEGDDLTIDGHAFSGHHAGPAMFGLRIEGTITWSTDSDNEAGGWKICARDVAPTSTSTTTTYAPDHSWRDLGPEPLHP